MNDRTPDRARISIVTPAFNEAASLPALHRRLREVLDSRYDWELLVVDDGSNDDTWDVLHRLHAEDSRVKGIHLLLNSGHMKALSAGVDHADGDLVITMDADLQHPPELLPEIIEKWRAGFLVVNTIRRDTVRQGLLKRLSSRLYYDVFRGVTGIPVKAGMADFRGMDRSVVLLVREYQEETLPLRFLLANLRLRAAELEYTPADRFAGETKYTVGRMLTFAAESLFSFSLAPLYFGYIVGGVFLFLFVAYSLFVLYASLVLHHVISGWASQILITLIASGVQFILFGIMGGYLGAISREVKRRPRYVVGRWTGMSGRSSEKPAP